jgi:hypothetical protein
MTAMAGLQTTVLEIAARAGLWALNKSYLSELGRHLHLGDGSALFEQR